MNKKEIAEIKRVFHPCRTTIVNICGCYINSEGEKILTKKTKFASLSEEEQFKYFDIFKKSLTGKVEQNLINISFPNNQEFDGGTQNFLMNLRNSALENDNLLEELYDKIISSYNFSGNYYITLINATHDIMSIAGDGSVLDASTDTYDFVLCAICPVSLAKPALAYNACNNNIEDRIRDWVVEKPMHGFLFPAYNDRNTDVHGALYFTKKDKDIQPQFVSELFGTNVPMSAKLQKEAFKDIIEQSLGDNYTFDVFKDIQDLITQKQFSADMDNETQAISFTKKELRGLIEKSGVAVDDLCNFDNVYDKVMKDYSYEQLKAENIVDTSKSVIKTANISINIKPESIDLVTVQVVDGKRCIVVPVNDNVIVNGIETKL